MHSDLNSRAFTVASMGFNPFRPQSKTAFDIAMVVIALAATIAVIVWAIVA